MTTSTAEASNLEEVKQGEKEEISPENDSKAGAPLTKEEKLRNKNQGESADKRLGIILSEEKQSAILDNQENNETEVKKENKDQAYHDETIIRSF